MKYHFLPALCAFLGVLSTVCIAPAPSAHAQEVQKIQLDVLSSAEPASAVVLLISQNRVKEILDTKIEKGPRGAYSVAFTVLSQEITADTVATALVISTQGEASFTPVKGLGTGQSLESLALLPNCEGEPLKQIGIAGQVALLNQLVDIRTKLRNVSRNKLQASLSGEFLDKLRKLEKGFGLSREKELDPSLSSLELVDRLTRIRSALQNWDKTNQLSSTPIAKPDGSQPLSRP
jgi:hypothetical protein